MYTNNWFKLHRKIFENGIWTNLKLFRFFVYLIGQAVFAEDGVVKGNIHIKRGQLLKSYRKIQEELEYIENKTIKSYSLSTIKRMIEKLKEKNMIKTEKTELGTLFTILNYAKYQDKEKEKDKKIQELRTVLEQQRNSDRTVTEHQRNNNKKVKKDKKEKKETCSDSKSSPNSPSNKSEKPKFDEKSMAYRGAKHLRKLILQNNPRQPVPDENPIDLEKWALELDRLNRLGPVGAKENEDKSYNWSEIGKIMEWCQQDDFWKDNILSAGKFREKIAQLENKMKKSNNRSNDKMKQLKEIYQEYEEGEGSIEVL